MDAILFSPMRNTRRCVVESGYIHCGYCDQYPCSVFPAEPVQEEIIRKVEVEKQQQDF